MDEWKEIPGDARPKDLELEAELRRMGGAEPRPRADYRAAVRGSFLAGAAPAESAEESGSPAEAAPRSPRDSMLENRLRELAPPPTARSAFRAELRDAFTTGRLAAPPAEPPAPLAETAATGAPSGPHPLSSGTWSWQLVTGLLATAAAVVLMVVFPGGDEVSRPTRNWNVVAVGSELEVDRVRFDAADGARLASAVNAGESLASLDASLRVTCESGFRFGMEPASHLLLPALASAPAPPETGEEASLVFELDEGTLHLSTDTDYAGRTIIVKTPHAKVRVTGSLLSIEVFADKGTCICVKSGLAEVEVLSGERGGVEVRGETSCFVFLEDREPVLGPSSDLVPPDHLQPLLEFYDEAY